ncbi:sigma-70 family RNA polymerase sigma factor, partial [Arsenicibacter rosenii]|uniref:sigma-70 family RNA polymerase sigma factor n=1 Tax=Arsenicibacter rosenii TaxID=1750698 RepID=UPI0015A61F6C
IDVDSYNKDDDEGDEHIKLTHAMLHLSFEERQLIKMKYFKMCTIAEISNDLNLSNSAIKMRLLRLRRKIQYLLLYID